MKYRGTETTILDKATVIMEDYLPIYWNSSNYRLDMLDVILCNKEWTMRMIKFEEKFRGLDIKTTSYTDFKSDSDMGGSESMITQTIMHDIGGLMKNDEHFLPRI